MSNIHLQFVKDLLSKYLFSNIYCQIFINCKHKPNRPAVEVEAATAGGDQAEWVDPDLSFKMP